LGGGGGLALLVFWGGFRALAKTKCAKMCGGFFHRSRMEYNAQIPSVVLDVKFCFGYKLGKSSIFITTFFDRSEEKRRFSGAARKQ
jgi:hypothetical protein